MDFRSFFSNSNRLFYVLIAAIALFVVVAIIYILGSIGGRETGPQANLKMWGVFDGTEVYKTIIDDFGKQNPGINIEYTVFSFEDYERKLINAFAEGTGPDIFLLHNTWLAKHKNKLSPMPSQFPGEDAPALTLKDFKEIFVDVTYDDLVADEKIYSLPLYVDTLAMYYNKDFLNTAGITVPPATWEQFNIDVEKLTKFDPNGNITQSGASLGASKNINRASDILMTMMIQSGVQMTGKDKKTATFSSAVNGVSVGDIALQYYTDFTNPSKRTYSWNENLHYSIDAFSEGTVAMMFNYSHQIDLLRVKNPRLNFAIAPIPQANLEDKRNFASYWAPGVAASSKNPIPAWRFIRYLASAEGSRAYLLASKRPAARRDIIELQKSDADIGEFAKQSLTARSWYQADFLAIDQIFLDMISDVNLGKLSPRDALSNAESKVNVLMRR